MANEFTAEELKEVIRAARIFNPGFSEEQFQSLTELEARLTDSGYLETVSGLLRLERETGVPLSQVFETRDRLPGGEGRCSRREPGSSREASPGDRRETPIGR